MLTAIEETILTETNLLHKQINKKYNNDLLNSIDGKSFKLNLNAYSVGIGGIHSKYICNDENNCKYIFKPYHKNELHRIYADLAAYRLALHLNRPTSVFCNVKKTFDVPADLGGSFAGKKASGSLQALLPVDDYNEAGSILNKFYKTNKVNEFIEFLQCEQVIDWILGNNDGRHDQFVLSNNEIIGVDKGQSFRWYNEDQLTLSYNPNLSLYGTSSIYVDVFNHCKKNKIKLNWKITEEYIDHLYKSIPLDLWVNISIDFAKNSKKWNGKTLNFENLLKERYNNLHNSFKKFYVEAEQISQNTVFVSLGKYASPTVNKINDDLVSRILLTKGNGYSAYFGGNDIEDMHGIFTSFTNKDNGKGLMMECKVRKSADNKVLSVLNGFSTSKKKRESVEACKYNNLENAVLPSNVEGIWDNLISVIKTVNHHAPKGGKNPDGKYNEKAMNWFSSYFFGKKTFYISEIESYKINLFSLSTDIYKRLESHGILNPFSIALSVAEHYTEIVYEINRAILQKEKTKKGLSAWSGDYSVPLKAKNNVNQHKTVGAFIEEFNAEYDGTLTRKYKKKSSLIEGGTKIGVSYHCFENGVEIHYYPHYSKKLSGKNNLRSQQGKLVLIVDQWNHDIGGICSILNCLKYIGLNNNLSTFDEIEYLYLKKIAWHQNGNLTFPTDWKSIDSIQDLGEKIKGMKELCESLYGCKPDVLETYMPYPFYDVEYGNSYFLNPYVLHHFKNNSDENFTIYHGISNNKTFASHKSHIVNYGLLSTERRMKYGIYLSGSSSQEDQFTGGASYVFTACESIGNKAFVNKYKNQHIVTFDNRMMARMDMIMYKFDAYGSTHKDSSAYGHTVSERMPIIDVVVKNKKPHEIIFKNKISLDTWGKFGLGNATYFFE